MIAIQAFLLMLLSLTGVMPASLWGWVGAREAKYAYQEAQPRPRYHLSCDENGKLAEYEADQMDYHQDIVQLWSESGQLTVLEKPICVVTIVIK